MCEARNLGICWVSSHTKILPSSASEMRSGAFQATALAVLCLALCQNAEAFYLPGVAPTDYQPGKTLNAKVSYPARQGRTPAGEGGSAGNRERDGADAGPQRTSVGVGVLLVTRVCWPWAHTGGSPVRGQRDAGAWPCCFSAASTASHLSPRAGGGVSICQPRDAATCSAVRCEGATAREDDALVSFPDTAVHMRLGRAR